MTIQQAIENATDMSINQITKIRIKRKGCDFSQYRLVVSYDDKLILIHHEQPIEEQTHTADLKLESIMANDWIVELIE